MGIYQRQFKEILAQELLRYLLEGRLPSVDELSSRISGALSKDGKVTYQYRPQPYKSLFQIDLYNKSLDHIKFDLDLLQEETLDLLSDSVKRITYADLYHKINSYNLADLKAKLKSALFTIANADYYFVGAFDNFLDSTKTDLTQSSPNVLNLSERCLNIPMGEAKTSKLKITHLSSYVSWPVQINAPAGASQTQVAGTAFANIFKTTTDVWAVEVTSQVSGPAEIIIKFPLAGPAESEKEVFINRIELQGHSPATQRVTLKFSTDDVNYTSPLGYENGILMSNLENVYALDFETNLVQYVLMTFRKESPDSESVNGDQKSYKYIFGLKNFSAYTIGRGTNAVYYSKPFSLSSNDGIISKVSIQSTFEKPVGTNISYYIGRKVGDSISYIPVNPVGTQLTSGVSDVVVLSNNVQNYNKFQVDTTGTGAATQYGSPFQGKVFYRIGPAISPDPIFGSVRLYRGYKLWYRDKSSAFKVLENNDTYINFGSSDSEYVYTTKSEVPTYENKVDPVSGSKTVVLTLSRSPYYSSSKGHALRPPAGVDTSIDSVPNYAIYKVLQTSTTTTLTRSIILGADNTQDLPANNFVIQSTDPSQLPELSSSNRATIYRPNIDYIIETEDVDGKLRPTGRFIIPTGSSLPLGTNLLLDFTYTIDPDITHKVTRIEGNFVTLSNTQINSGDSVVVTYRYVPSSPTVIIGPSVRLFSAPSSNRARRVYIEGTDYSFNPTTGLVQKLGSGAIGTSAYLDFKYKDSTDGIQTFTIWAKVANPSGIQIKFELNNLTKKNKLSVDTESGETFYVNGPQGLIDISKTTVTNLLGPGWIQFIVRSKDPDSNITLGSNLIDQVIQLRDSSGKKIFKEGNAYFSELVAFREPMSQRTLNHLRVNTLMSDHQSFAIDDFTDVNNSYVVVNFNPTTTDELYNRIATDDNDLTSRPALAGEIFYMTWESKNQNIDSADSNIVVRIDLERETSTDGALSPKVFDYQIRAST